MLCTQQPSSSMFRVFSLRLCSASVGVPIDRATASACDYFALLHVPPCAAPPTPDWRKALTKRYHECQGQCHPDVSTEDNDLSARLNAAFECLKDPLLRSRYLLTLQGVKTNPDTGGIAVKLPGGFLMEMLSLNEAIMEGEGKELAAVRREAEGKFSAKLIEVEASYQSKEWDVMAVRVAELGYIQSALRRISDVELDNSLKE